MPLLGQSFTVKFAYNYLENKVVLSTSSPEVKLIRIPSSLQSHSSHSWQPFKSRHLC